MHLYWTNIQGFPWSSLCLSSGPFMPFLGVSELRNSKRVDNQIAQLYGQILWWGVPEFPFQIWDQTLWELSDPRQFGAHWILPTCWIADPKPKSFLSSTLHFRGKTCHFKKIGQTTQKMFHFDPNMYVSGKISALPPRTQNVLGTPSEGASSARPRIAENYHKNIKTYENIRKH